MNSPLPENAAVWFEIPVSDMGRSQAFYASVLQNDLKPQDEGDRPTAIFPTLPGNAVSGHICPGTPATAGAGPTIHLAAPVPLEAALGRVTENGGQVVSPVIDIPDGRFAYCLDLDGNSFGLFTR